MNRLLGLLFLATTQCWGAATISFASGSIASSGGSAATTTISILVAGNVGSCSPSSGLTNIVVHDSGGAVFAQTSAGCSTSTITIVLNAAILSGETVQVDFVAGSNLTDTASNSIVASANNALTNSSTLSGSLINSGFNVTTATTTAFISQWDAASGSPTHTTALGSQAIMATTAHCSALDMYTNWSGQWKVILDGSTGSLVNPGVGTWGWYRVYNGASDANHAVSVQNGGFFYFATGTNNLRCVSSAPALALQSADFAVQAAPDAAGIANDGSPAIGSNSGYAINTSWPGVSGLRFTTASPSLSLFGYFCDLTALKVWRDGSLLSTVSVTSGCSIRTAVQVFSGQIGSHTYEITPYNSGNGGSSDWHLDALLLPAGQTISSSGPAARQTIGCYGDSICWGSGVSQTDQIEGWLNTRSLAVGYNKQGNPGEQVCTFLQNNTSQITSISPAGAAIIMQGGVNDERASVSIGDITTPDTFTYCVYHELLNAGASLSTATSMLVRAILPYADTNFAARSTYIAAQSTATASYNADKPAGYPDAVYYDTTNWLNTSTQLNADKVHPNASGYTAVNNLDAPVLASHISSIGSAYTLSCPGAGSAKVGIAITCTVALAGGATWAALSVGNSPAEMLNCSVSTVTGTFNKSFPWNPTAGGNSDTFTFTPASAGTGAISCVATSDAWVDPSSLPLLVTSNGSSDNSVRCILDCYMLKQYPSTLTSLP